MKALICCDEHGYFCQGIYYLKEFEKSLIDRYLFSFESIRLVIRIKIVDSIDLAILKPVDPSRIEVFSICFFQGYKDYLFNYFKVKSQLTNVIGDCRVAIIRLPSTIGFMVLEHVKEKKIPIGLEIVANPKELCSQNKNLVVKFLYWIYHMKLIHATKIANGIAYVTEFSLQKNYPVINNHCITTNYSTARIDDSCFYKPRTDKNDIHSDFIICHVSHPIKTLDKGHTILIEVLLNLKSRGYHHVKVKFAGDGEFVQRFQKYAKKLGVSDSVEFVGFLSNKQLKSFLIESDIMVFPTISEGLPRVLIEAMATGLPCISTDVGGIPELLPSSFTLRPDDVNGFTDKIIEIIDSPELYCELSKQNFEKSKLYIDSVLQQRRNRFYDQLKNFQLENQAF